jgi:hypothetical protein
MRIQKASRMERISIQSGVATNCRAGRARIEMRLASCYARSTATYGLARTHLSDALPLGVQNIISRPDAVYSGPGCLVGSFSHSSLHSRAHGGPGAPGPADSRQSRSGRVRRSGSMLASDVARAACHRTSAHSRPKQPSDATGARWPLHSLHAAGVHCRVSTVVPCSFDHHRTRHMTRHTAVCRFAIRLEVTACTSNTALRTS